MVFFIPTVVNEWNALSVDTRQLKVTPFVFLKKQLAANIAYDNCDTTAHQSKPQFYSIGDTYKNIIHTKLRHYCAFNSDLFRCNIIDSPLSSCGKAGDTYHYFFSFTQYSQL